MLSRGSRCFKGFVKRQHILHTAELFPRATVFHRRRSNCCQNPLEKLIFLLDVLFNSCSRVLIFTFTAVAHSES
jgi:hypothetical protein